MKSWQKWTQKGYRVLILGIWIGACVWLVRTYYSRGSTPTYISLDTGLVDITDETEWMDIYLNGEKVGYSFNAIQTRNPNQIDLNSFMALHLVVAGVPSTITSQYHAEVDSAYHLNLFDFFLHSGAFQTHLTGEREGAQLAVHLIDSEDTTTFYLDAPPDLAPSMAIRSLLVHHGIAPGETVQIPIYEPMSQSLATASIHHLGREEFLWDSTKITVNKLQVDVNGFPSFLYLDDNGLTYKEESALGLEMIRSAEVPDITDFSSSSIDIAALFAVPLEGHLPRDRFVSELTVRIQGLSPAALPSSPLWNYRVSPSDSTRFRFRSAGWRDRPPVPEDEAGNAFIQSQRPEIRKLARSLVTQPADSLRAARELLRFVYTTLEKVPVANLSTALDILAQKKGDCSEHTTLYASLSRALRIPTRVRIGLVHLQGRFLYHAWPVVYSQGQWWDVDPTLNQFPADATHIPLLEGDPAQLSGLLPGLGRLSITLLDYETSHVAN